MPIVINNPSGATSGTASEDYFLDDEGNLTTDEAAAATLLIRKGQEVPKEMADKYGIGKVAQTDETAADTVSEKAEKPSKNKAEKPAENKAA